MWGMGLGRHKLLFSTSENTVPHDTTEHFNAVRTPAGHKRKKPVLHNAQENTLRTRPAIGRHIRATKDFSFWKE